MLGLGNLLTKSGVIKKFPNDFSFNFDGSNDYLEAGESSALGTGTNFSISFWFKSEATSKAYMAQIQKGASSSGLAFLANAIGTGASAGNITALVWNGSTHLNLSFDGSIDDGEWHHIAFTTTSSAQVLYFDGQSVDTDTIAFTNAFDSNPVVIGARGGGAEPFNGLIDEFAIWDTVLSSDDVAKIYKKPVDLSKPSKYATDRTANLKLWLRCGDKAEPESTTAIARQDFYTDFDGTDDYVSVPTLFSGGNAYSVSAWVYSSSSANIINQCDTSGNSNIYIQRVDTNAYRAYLSSNDNTTYKYETTNNGVATVAGWDFVTATFNVATNTILIYVNGILQSTTSNSGGTNATAISTNTNACAIGVRPKTTPDTYWNGKITSVSVHQTILDAQTISQMAKSRFTPMRDNRFSVVDFDGVNDFIDIPDNDALDAGSGDMTITFWYNPLSMSANMEIIDKYDTSSNKGYRVRHHNGTSKIFFNINDGADTDGYYSYIDVALSYGQWYHVTIIWDNSEQQATYYINGVNYGRLASTSLRAIGDTSNSVPLRFGGTQAGGSDYKGSISSVAIYNVARTSEEDYACYQKGITHNPSADTGLVGLWRMGDDTSREFPTIADSSSNSNDGTITNGASDDIVQQMVAGYDLGAFESSSEELGGEIASDNFGGWTLNGWTDNGDGTASANNSSGGNQDLTIYYSFTEFIIYKMTATFSNISGTFYYNLDATGSLNKTITTNGEHILYVQAPSGGSGHFFIRSSNGSSATISNVSIKEVLQSEVSDTYPAIIDVNEPVLGVELFPTSNSDYDVSTGVWSKDTASPPTLTYGDSSNGSASISASDITINTSKTYKITFTVSSLSSGTADITFNSASNEEYMAEESFANGTFTRYFTTPSSHNGGFRFRSDVGSGSSFNVSDYSIKEVQGNVGTMTNFDNANSGDIMYGSVLPDQSFLTGVNSAYNFLDFDGSDAYIPISVTALGDAFTLSAWVYFNIDASSGDYDYIINVGALGTRTNFSLGRFEDGAYYYFDGTSSKKSTSFTFSTTTWTHILATVQPTSNRVKLYINGEEQDVAQPDGDFNISSSTGSIGRFQPQGLHYLNGRINNVAIINKTISSSDVSSIYNLGRHGNLLDSYSDNLVNYYAFGALDGKTGFSDTDSTIYDRSGNSNHGTTSGTATGDLKSPPNAEPNGYAKGDTNRSTTTP